MTRFPCKTANGRNFQAEVLAGGGGGGVSGWLTGGNKFSWQCRWSGAVVGGPRAKA